MKDRVKSNKRLLTVLVLVLLICGVLVGKKAAIARAQEELFSIDAQLRSQDFSTYDIQVVVSNSGENWEGTARIRLENTYYSLSCVYDTVLSLPQGSTKQFLVKIPKESVEDIGASVSVSLLDGENKLAASKVFSNLFLEGRSTLSMGVLSDSYASLTYLDMEGVNLYYNGAELPIKLYNLNQDNLMQSLENGLNFFVIDNYNTSILTDLEQERIQRWVEDGGMLIVGTGERAEDVLSGLKFLGIECSKVNAPNEHPYQDHYNSDLTKLYMAELNDVNDQYDTNTDIIGFIASRGDGAVELVPYSLSKLVPQDVESYVYDLLVKVNSYTKISYSTQNKYYDNEYVIRRIFRTFGNGGNRLNFNMLKVIVVLYVIFVGPVLYLILRFLKKRDFYWIAVPITTLVGILLIYITGRGFEVVDTRVYSVTVEELDASNQDAVTYMHCYDAGHKEWMLQLAEGYEYCGPLWFDYYNSQDSEKYRSHIVKEGERISFGLNPSAGFEDAYFKAGTVENEATGKILLDIQPVDGVEISGTFVDDMSLNILGMNGTVTNETDWDFEYFAVIAYDTLFIYNDLPAGETCDLSKAMYLSSKSYDNVIEDYLHGYMNEVYRGKEEKDADFIAALGIGVSVAVTSLQKDPDAMIVVGVTKDWNKAVDDNCSETSYGCLYSVQ